VQWIKGGFSFRVKHELGSALQVWPPGAPNHRIPDAADYARQVEYIGQNPVKRRLVENAREYPNRSASEALEVDPAPPGLKAQSRQAVGSPG